ncbi:MAG: CRISPR system precrRNA processing endoribonuclease RAMP protein Cas6 [Lentisphaeria bacterium]|nr:CRISPR system precrRNA processing endoribonuclease RAMP protein Cas6 [Lentisphaeria bacterium]
MFRIKTLNYEFASPYVLGLHDAIPTITFRGAFGYALAQVIAREACVPELAEQVDLYRRFFMPENDGEENSRNHDLARPFELRGFYSREDKRSFILQIQLFGKAIEHEQLFDHVIEVISYMGIGNRHQVCHFEKLRTAETTPEALTPTEHLMVYYLTPCVRLKSGGRIYSDFIPFHVLLPRLIDRLTELDNLYGDGSFEQSWDIGGMKRASRRIADIAEKGVVCRTKRTSSRTKQEMHLKGFQGKALYEGDFTAFLEPLKYLPHVNIGRFNVFGCGWCTLEFQNNNPLMKGAV